MKTLKLKNKNIKHRFSNIALGVIILIIQVIIMNNYSYAQIESVPVSNPVYQFLTHIAGRGFLPHSSFANLPLERSEIVNLLSKTRSQSKYLSNNELNTLHQFEHEFDLIETQNAVVFYSASDTNEILFKRILSNDEKFIYKYKDSTSSVNIVPMGSIENISEFIPKNNSSRNSILGNLGFRLHGTLSSHLGYYLQATNGTLLSGNRELALEDPRLHQNVKFSELNSDFDFTESHVRIRYDWFSASIGRETRLIGSGMSEKLFLSQSAPPFDAITLGAKFSNFEYNIYSGELLSIPVDSNNIPILNIDENGSYTRYPPKYNVIHRFALKPSWGELALTDIIIYANRNQDIAYFNPLSFLKSLEHALHDRDNSIQGIEMTVRPIDGITLSGSFLLDDIVFKEIGTGYWSNKTASNVSIMMSLPTFDFGVEYSRVEPYTFSHYNIENSYTNDKLRMGSSIPANSDCIAFQSSWFYGNRYPLIVRLAYIQHGENITDSIGKVIKNVGSDPLLVRRPDDAYTVTFLDGIKQNILSLQIKTGFEIIRGFNFQFFYEMRATESIVRNYLRIGFRYNDF